jgi:hypothetical protein
VIRQLGRRSKSTLTIACPQLGLCARHACFTLMLDQLQLRRDQIARFSRAHPTRPVPQSLYRSIGRTIVDKNQLKSPTR